MLKPDSIENLKTTATELTLSLDTTIGMKY